MPSTVDPVVPRNLDTAFSTPQVVFATAADVRESYRTALAAERMRAPSSRPGHRLYWMGGGHLAGSELASTSSGYVIAGRHTNCDIVLGADPTLSLRHVLVRSLVLDDGCPLLSVVDLKTTRGFELAEGTPQRALTATGPVVLRMGAYVMVAFPSGGDALPDDLPPAIFAEPPLEASQPEPYRSPAPRSNRLSCITLMPHLVELGDGPRPQASHGDYSLSARSQQGQIATGITEAELRHGILLGRAPRCCDGGLSTLLSPGISRVHLLLIRERDNVVAYDIASTQGTFDGAGGGVRRFILNDEGTRFRIGGHECAVELDWRAR